MAQFSEFLDRSGTRAVATCPYVYTQYSSKRLLTMERLYGSPLTDLDAIRAVTSADPETTLINALNTWIASVLYCDTFHADVHAGNLLVMQVCCLLSCERLVCHVVRQGCRSKLPPLESCVTLEDAWTAWPCCHVVN